MVERRNPVKGDVVIGVDVRDAERLYVLRVLPQRSQFGYARRATALAKACAFAERLGVDAWYAGQSGYQLLGHFRHPNPAPVAP